MRKILGRDAEGKVIDIEVEGTGPIAAESDGGGGVHPGLATHTGLGLAAAHAHPYAADDHTHQEAAHDHDANYSDIAHSHEGGDHPDLASHSTLGLATDAELAAHDHTGVYATDVHSHALYATDTDLSDHAATAHGLSAHAIDGAYHTGTTVLPSAGQKNALAGTSGTPGDANRYVTNADSRLSDARTPSAHTHDYAATSHSHLDADIPAGIARDAEVTAAIAAHVSAETHGGEGGSLPTGIIVMWGGLAANIPSGWALCDGQNGTPDLRDRFIKGAAVAGATGGSATHTHDDHAALTHSGTAVGNHTVTQPTIAGESSHTHTYTQVVNHVHVQTVNSATTGGLSGYTPDTSSNTPAVSGYSTQNPTGGVATGTTAAGSSHAHTASGAAVDAHSVTQPGQHAAQSHASASSEPAYYALCFIQKV